MMTDIKIPERIVEDKNISAGAKIVYGKVLKIASKKGYCDASNKFLDSGGSGRNVSRYIQQLLKAGYLESQIEQNHLRKLYISE